VDGAPSAGELRRWVAQRRRFATTSPWYRLYLVALVGLPALIVALNADPQVTPQRITEVLTAVGRWLPLVVAAALVGCARIGTWAGLVVPPRGEVVWVFSAPLSRAGLLRGRIVYGLSVGAAAGALVGYFGGLVLIADLDPTVVQLLGVAVVAGALLGVVGATAMWWAQSSGDRARWVLRFTPHVMAVLLIVGVGIAVWPPLGTVVAWSGPWGWASLLIVAGAGGEVGAVAVAAGLLALAAGVAGWWTIVSAPALPVEELARRADAVSGVQAAMFFFDVRLAAELRRSAQRSLRSTTVRRVRPPTRSWLIVPWTDLRELLRSPGWAVTLATTGGVVFLVATNRATGELAEPLLAPITVGVIGAALAAMQLVAPLRTEASFPFAERHLPWSAARVGWMHLIAPTLLLVGSFTVAWGLAATAGLPVRLAGPGLAFSLLAAPLLVLTAALGATLPPPSTDLLMAGDAGAAAFGARLFAGPQLVAVAVLAPTWLILIDADRPTVTELLIGATIWTAIAGFGAVFWLRHQLASHA